jgi:hypothetical protein
VAAFDSSAAWRGYTAARGRRPNAASGERAAMRTEDEDPPTQTFVIYHLYGGSQPERWYSTPNEVAEGVVECFSAQLRQWLRECILHLHGSFQREAGQGKKSRRVIDAGRIVLARGAKWS